MKKPLRLLLRLAGVFALLVAVFVGLAFTPAVQTWAVRRALGHWPGVKVELGRVSIGLNSVQVENLRIFQPGFRLAVPSADLDLPVIAALRGRVRIARLTAKDWTLDLTPAVAASEAAMAASVFEGMFQSLQLPVDFSLAAAELEGDVTQPDGRAHLVLTGGQLGAGSDASLAVNARLVSTLAAAPPVSALTVQGTISAHMDTPRSFSKLGFTADATAAGPKLAPAVTAHITVGAAREGQDEHYTLALDSGGKQLARLTLALPAAAGAALTGTWALDASDHDLEPFLLGHPSPVFEATGQGTFASTRDFGEITAVGKLKGTAKNLGVLRPELAVWGRTEFAADFDVVKHGDATRVTRLSVRLNNDQAQPAAEAPQTVASVEALQGFEYNAATGELKVADPAADLLKVVFKAPLAWVQPFLAGANLAVSIDSPPAGADPLPGGAQQAEGFAAGTITAGAHDGGLTFHLADFRVAGTVRNHAGEIIGRADGRTSKEATLNYSPHGWEVAVPQFRFETPEAGDAPSVPIVEFDDIRAGQAAGRDQPVKIQGTYSGLGLGPLGIASPVIANALPLTNGEADGNFTAVLAAQRALALKLHVRTLPAAALAAGDLAMEVRADIAADGGITLNTPVTLTADGRVSAFTMGGRIGPAGAGPRPLDLQLAGETVYFSDVAGLAGAGVTQAGAAPGAAPAPTMAATGAVQAGPPWAGLAGTVKFAFKRVVYSPGWESNLEGTVKLESDEVAVAAHGTLGADAPFKVNSRVVYTPGAAPPYALKADLALDNFDTAPLMRTVEGRADFHFQLTSHAATVAGLADGLQGKVDVTSKGGICRLLAVNDDNSGLLQSAAGAGASFLGGVVGVVAGDTAGANAAKSVTDIAGLLHEIHYDQLNLTLSRGATQDLVLDDFNLIAPEVRLEGRGKVRHLEGEPLLEQPLTLQLAVAARGALGGMMAAVGLVGPTPDSLGYQPLVLDLPELGGTLAAPNTNAFYQELAKRAARTATDRITNGVKKGAGALLNGLLGK
jgi:hypothetical protein